VTQPAASAEYLKSGKWVWTPIPSGSIIDNPQARELTAEEFDKFRNESGSAPEDAASEKPKPRGMRP